MNRIELLKNLSNGDCATAIASFAIGILSQHGGIEEGDVIRSVSSLREQLLTQMTEEETQVFHEGLSGVTEEMRHV